MVTITTKRRRRRTWPRAITLYRGPSMLGAGNILVVLTASDNRKLGTTGRDARPVVQVWILPEDGLTTTDSCCPADCPFRPTAEGAAGGCYVDPRVWRSVRRAALKREVEAPLAWDLLVEIRPFVRLGAFGDPAAMPPELVADILHYSVGHTAYTHAWRRPTSAWLRPVAMASCESSADATAARAMGWRTYTVAHSPSEGEIPCPSLRGVKCAECGLCDGRRGRPAPSISIPPHGGTVARRQAEKVVG